MAKRKLEIIIAGDASGLNRALGQVDKFGAGLKSKVKTATKAAGIALGAGMFAAGRLGWSALTEAAESAKINRLTDAVLKSTGGVANVTAQQVQGLATSISNLTGVDDETVQSAENLLLTFTNVRNEVGKGNDIFDQATRSAVDMAAALGTEPRKAAMQLGKALNDPIKGVTALSRSGVSFTAQQKEQIKTLTESGRTLEAQKIILGEVGKEFGGAAEAAADPMVKLKTIANNALESIGAVLLPFAEKAATWLGEKIPQALDWLRGKWPAIKAAAEPVMRAIGVAVRWVADAIGDVVDFVVDHWPQVQAVWDRVTKAIRDAVAKYWPGVRDVIIAAVERIRSIIETVVHVALALWDRFGSTILDYVTRTWDNVKRMIAAALEFVRGIIKTVTSLIKGDWSGVWNGIKAAFGAVWDAMKAAVDQALNAIKYAISLAWDAISGIFSGAWDGIKSAFSSAWEGIKSTASNGVDAIVGFITELPGKLLGLAGDFLSAGAELAGGILQGMKDGLTGTFEFAGDVAAAIFDALKQLWNDFANWVNDKIPDEIGWGIATIDLPDNPIPTFDIKHTGGIVGGRGEVPTLLEAGEGVITGPTVDALARDLFRRRRPQVGAAPTTGATTAGGGVTVVVNVAGDLVAQAQLERHLADVVARSVQRGGPLAHSIRRTAGAA